MLLWTIYRGINDRGKLKVTCFFGNMIGGIEPPNKLFLVYRVVNTGTKPINVTMIGGAFEDNNFMVSCPQLPRKLDPGEYLTQQSPDLQIFERDVKFLGAWDSLDKIWKVKRKTLKKLQKHFIQGKLK